MDNRDERELLKGFEDRTSKPVEEPLQATDEYPEQEPVSAPPTYYSYGTYRSEASEVNRSQIPRNMSEETEVTTAAPVFRSFAPSESSAAFSSSGKVKKKSIWMPVMAAFLAGVLSVGSLMYAADVNNWFTPKATQVSQGASEGSGAQGAGGSNTSGQVQGVSATIPADEGKVASLFKQASPAVVLIETFVKSSSRSGSSLFDDPIFRQFFGDNYPSEKQQDNDGALKKNGIGSGFFFDADGYILTNEHVINGADEIKVTVEGMDEPLTAELLGSSYELDLAVLKVKGDAPFPTLPLGDSDQTAIGDWVIAIGNPYGFEHTLTMGIVSAKERPIDIPDSQGTRQYKHLLQTDASINPGNSGGPLLNLKGEVVGINTAVNSQAQGIGFAIPTSTIYGVVDNLKNNESIPRPFIGVSIGDVTQEVAAQLGLETQGGAFVSSVVLNSPAYNAEIRQYDVITGVNGTAIATGNKLNEAIGKMKIGDVATLDVVRGGKKIQIDVVIGDKNQFANNK